MDNEELYGRGAPLADDQIKARSDWLKKVSGFQHVIRQAEIGTGPYEGEQLRNPVSEGLAVSGYEGNLFTSEIRLTDEHTIALDIDVPMHVEPSSTPGHHHLYIDVPLEWDDYAELLTLLGRLGVLEPGYVAASLARKGTHLRLPWIRKDQLPKDTIQFASAPAEPVYDGLLD